MLFRSIFLASPGGRVQARHARRSFSQRSAARRAIAALSALDDHTLRDIGVSRSEIAAVVVAGGT